MSNCLRAPRGSIAHILPSARRARCDNGRQLLNIQRLLPSARDGIKHLDRTLSKQDDKQTARGAREAMLEALPRLRRFARSLTGNRHDADDLLQNTVERVLDRGVPEQVDVARWMFK